MTHIVDHIERSPGFSIENGFFAQLKNHLGHAFSLKPPLPNESRILHVVRKIFELLGKAIKQIGIGLGQIPMIIVQTPFWAVGKPIELLMKPGVCNHYEIGEESTPLDKEELEEELKGIAQSKRKIKTLEIIHGGTTPFKVLKSIADQIKKISPEALVFKKFQIDKRMLSLLETDHHYYEEKNDESLGEILERKEAKPYQCNGGKEELVKQVKELVANEKRVKILISYYDVAAIDEIQSDLDKLGVSCLIQYDREEDKLLSYKRREVHIPEPTPVTVV